MSKSFGVDFGQKVDLTASIRGILRNYPEGTAILKELVQNADDAKARTVKFCVDLRTHGQITLAGPGLSGFQGPALLAYNDAKFSENDFISIQRIGDSMKKTEETKDKIGRFGIGFNAVYHWTDLPSFISSKYLVLLDPSAKFLPDINPSNPGKMVGFLDDPEIVKTYRDQFAPYEGFEGLEYSKEFNGTLFRLPLRSTAQAESSLLSKRSLSRDDALEILGTLKTEATAMLLFLKCVERIDLLVWSEGEEAPRVTFSCGLTNSNAKLRELRSFINSSTQTSAPKLGGGAAATATATAKEPEPIRGSKTADYQLVISCDDNGEKYTETWEICNQLGGDAVNQIANHKDNSLLRLVPWAGVAAFIGDSRGQAIVESAVSAAASGAKSTKSGLAYCFLPLPVFTKLPVMVNGFFELSSNRRDVWQAGPDMTGDGRTRAEWNVQLIRDVIAPCYARLLVRLKAALGWSLNYQQFWPSVDLPSPWDNVTNSTFPLLGSSQLLSSDSSLECYRRSNLTKLFQSSWFDCKSALVLPLVSSSAAPDPTILTTFLAFFNQPVIQCIPSLHEALVKTKSVTQIATPDFVRGLLLAKSASFFPNDVQMEEYVIERICPFLLKYCLSDINLKINQNDISKLNGLRLLPLLNGTVGSLNVFSAEQAQQLEQICSMGFSITKSIFAFKKSGYNLNQALELINGGDMKDFNNAEVLILAEDNVNEVFTPGASKILINKAVLDVNDVEVLYSTLFQLRSNIRTFTPGLIKDFFKFYFTKESY